MRDTTGFRQAMDRHRAELKKLWASGYTEENVTAIAHVNLKIELLLATQRPPKPWKHFAEATLKQTVLLRAKALHDAKSNHSCPTGIDCP